MREPFEKNLGEYLDAVITIEKKEHTSQLQSFAIREKEIREGIGGAYREFHTKFAEGYQILLEELKREMDLSDSKEDLLLLAKVDKNHLEIFRDPDALIKAMDEGTLFYELMGFSETTLSLFCGAAVHLMEAKQFEKARDLLRFLMLLAPHLQQLPLLLGKCYISLNEYDAAQKALYLALDMDATSAAAYLPLIDLFIQMHDFNQASSLCDAGLRFASEHAKEAWADSLRISLEEQKTHIIESSRKFKNS